MLVNACRSLVGSALLYASHFPLRNIERLCPNREFLPLLVDLTPETLNNGPFNSDSLQSLHPYCELLRPCAPHQYSCSVETSHLSFSLASGRQVPVSVHEPDPEGHAAFMPDAVRAAIEPAQDFRPGATTSPGFDIVDTLSTRHRRFALLASEPHLTGSCPAFSITLTTTALDRRSLRWFGACP